jgi:hypothetical protein
MTIFENGARTTTSRLHRGPNLRQRPGQTAQAGIQACESDWRGCNHRVLRSPERRHEVYLVAAFLRVHSVAQRLRVAQRVYVYGKTIIRLLPFGQPRLTTTTIIVGENYPRPLRSRRTTVAILSATIRGSDSGFGRLKSNNGGYEQAYSPLRRTSFARSGKSRGCGPPFTATIYTPLQNQ